MPKKLKTRGHKKKSLQTLKMTCRHQGNNLKFQNTPRTNQKASQNPKKKNQGKQQSKLFTFPKSPNEQPRKQPITKKKAGLKTRRKLWIINIFYVSCVFWAL